MHIHSMASLQVLLPAPYWPSYSEKACLARAPPDIVDCLASKAIKDCIALKETQHIRLACQQHSFLAGADPRALLDKLPRDG